MFDIKGSFIDGKWFKDGRSLDITNPNIELDYIGIHIRGTDRIVSGENVPFGFQSNEDLEKCIELTQKYLQELKNPLPLAIFSEDNNLKKRVENNQA